MGDPDAFAAFAAMVLVAEGDESVPVLKSDSAREALRRDAVRLRSWSKKTRRSALLPRLGMSLSYAWSAPSLCGIIIPQAIAATICARSGARRNAG
jgi:hypothetical protein